MGILQAIATAARCVEKRTTIPILGHVRLVSDDGVLSVTGTDMDRRYTVLADYRGPSFDVTLPARELLAFAKGSGSLIFVVVDKDSVAVVGDNGSEIVLPSLPSADFPVWPDPGPGTPFTVNSAELTDALACVAHAASTEETRYYLNGVYVHAHNGFLRFVATDGHRLAIRDTDIAAPEGFIAGIWPAAFVKDVIATFKKPAMIDISVEKTRVWVSTLTVALSSKLIDGTFPDYLRVIPSANDNPMIIVASEIKSLTCGLSKKERDNPIRFDGDTLTLGARKAKSAHVAPIRIEFSARYVSDMITAFGASNVIVMINTESDPLLAESGQLTYVLMPMGV